MNGPRPESSSDRDPIPAGDRFLISMWLGLILIALRVILQVYVDRSAEQLHGHLLLENAVEHVLFAADKTWVLVAVLTLLPQGRGLMVWFRGAACFWTCMALLFGVPGGEIQYRPALESLRGAFGVAAVVLASTGVALLDRWATSPRRIFYRSTPATRFLVTAMVLMISGGTVYYHVRVLEIRRDFMPLEVMVADFLDELPEAEVLAMRPGDGPRVGSLLPVPDVRDGGGNRPALVMPPDAAVEFSVPLRRNCWLRFACGVDQASLEAPGDFQVAFTVEVNGEELFRQSLDPKRSAADRVWQDASIDLSHLEEDEVQVALKTTLQASAEYQGWLEGGGKVAKAGFGQPMIERHEYVTRIQTRPALLNVVLVVADSLRADHLSCYGYDRETSPHIDALARESVLYENAMAPASWTSASEASILSGWYPASHGVLDYDRCYFSDAVQTLAERLQHQPGGGITTGGWSANPMLSRHTNFHQGFEVWREFHYRPGVFVTREFRDFLRRYAGYQFFTYLHYVDPHFPYAPPAAFRTRFAASDELAVNKDLSMRARALALGEAEARPPGPEELRQLIDLYDGEVSAFDHEVRRLRQFLEAAGVWEQTLLVITSNHGEEFMERGGLGHAYHLHRELLHVPLIVRVPGRTMGERVTDVVDTTRIAATILSALNLQWSKPLSPPLPPWSTDEPAVAMAETEMGILGAKTNVSLWSWQNNEFKLIRSEDGSFRQLYDLRTDPDERVDLSGREPDVLHRLEVQLQGRIQRLRASSKSRPFETMDQETLRSLEKVGYLPAGG